jgi:hypothetical protein
MAELTLILLLSVAAGTQLVELGSANPYLVENVKEGEVPPPNGTKPPEILVLSPANKTAYPLTTISLNFNVSVPQPENAPLPLSELAYRGSWQSEKTTINIDSLYRRHKNIFPFNIVVNLTDLPEGPHWVTVNATATGFGGWTRTEYGSNGYVPVRYDYYVTYSVTTQEAVNFTIDTTIPNISILTLQNKTYNAPDVLLDFAVNEELSQVAYSLDGGDNVTISGNATLAGLPVGFHNVTVFAWDAAGNVGTSETVTFTVAEPEPPIEPVTAVPVVAVAACAGLLLLTRRKRHKEAKQA